MSLCADLVKQTGSKPNLYRAVSRQYYMSSLSDDVTLEFDDVTLMFDDVTLGRNVIKHVSLLHCLVRGRFLYLRGLGVLW